MNTAELIRDLDALPMEARQEAADFVAFLKLRYLTLPAARKLVEHKLSEEPFIGMWQDRKDFADSTSWVRELRDNEWKPKA